MKLIKLNSKRAWASRKEEQALKKIENKELIQQIN